MNLDSETKIAAISTWLGNGCINIFGMPFSGKDTHGHHLAASLGAELISGGDILRSAAGPEHIKQHIAKGHLAPTDEYLSIILPYLSQERLEGKPIILSSVGRWHGEEPGVLKAAKAAGHPLKAVINLEVSPAEVMKRWQTANRGRDDDAAEHILERRLQEFHDKTVPVIEFYRQKNLVIDIDGMPAIDTVSNAIIDQLYTFSQSD